MKRKAEAAELMTVNAESGVFKPDDNVEAVEDEPHNVKPSSALVQGGSTRGRRPARKVSRGRGRGRSM